MFCSRWRPNCKFHTFCIFIFFATFSTFCIFSHFSTIFTYFAIFYSFATFCTSRTFFMNFIKISLQFLMFRESSDFLMNVCGSSRNSTFYKNIKYFLEVIRKIIFAKKKLLLRFRVELDKKSLP